MDETQRALWDSILLGHPVADGLEVELLLSQATDDDVRWVVRGFEPGAEDLLARWQTYTAANTSAERADDDALQRLATAWAAQVADSAAVWGLDALVAHCALDASMGERPTRPHQADYLDWIARVNDAVLAAPDQQVGAPELRDAYWGATNFHEFVWYLSAPITTLPVDPTPCIDLLAGGGLCWITDNGPIVTRFR